MTAAPARDDLAPEERPAASAIAALARGEAAVLLDDEGVGHLVRDGRRVETADVVAMLDAGGGIFSVVLAASRCAELGLEPQGRGGEAGSRRIAASIDAREGTTTGISAAERANTVRLAADPATCPSDLVVPGHVPPLIAADGGVFARRGAEEGALDLIRLAGAPGAAAICAILDLNGRTLPAEGVRAAAAERGLPLATITEVAARRIAQERPLRSVRRERLVTHYGNFAGVTFANAITGESELALVRGVVEGRREVPVAVHTSSRANDLISGLLPGGESGLARTLKRFARVDAGVLLHFRDRQADDLRALDLAAVMLLELGLGSVLPLDADLTEPLRERGIEVARPRNTPRTRPPRGDRCGFDYEVDTAI